jgi:hypothetical protein
MSIVSELRERMKRAMKEGRKEELGSIRYILAELKRASIDARGELDHEAEVQVLKRELKKRKEAAQAFSDGGRPELAAHEESEALLIEEFLPAQLEESAVAALIEEAVGETGASSLKDMGKVMAHVMAKAGSQVDGREVSRLVKERLST